MKIDETPFNRNYRHQDALSLVELSATIALLLTFASLITFSLSGLSSWKLGRRASVELQSVYMAQKSYLADHPTQPITSVTSAQLIPYMPGGTTSIPTAEAIEGFTLTINFNVMPPTLGSGGSPYDPSGASDDSLWDVGDP